MKTCRWTVIVICFAVLVMMSGCATIGPLGATGAAAVISGPVDSSNGAIHAKGQSDTCFIKFRDETGLGLDLKSDVVLALSSMGIREVPDEDDADYVIDMVSQNFFSGQGNGPVAGTVTGAAVGSAVGGALAGSGVLRPGAALGVGLGALPVGAAIDAANTPNLRGVRGRFPT